MLDKGDNNFLYFKVRRYTVGERLAVQYVGYMYAFKYDKKIFTFIKFFRDEAIIYPVFFGKDKVYHPEIGRKYLHIHIGTVVKIVGDMGV